MTIATVARRHPLLDLAADAPSWDGAACHGEDPEMWFHDDFHGTAATAATDEAKSICRHCDIREQCLAWALAHRIPFGVWGALDTDERKQPRRPMPHLHDAHPRRQPRRLLRGMPQQGQGKAGPQQCQDEGDHVSARITAADVKVVVNNRSGEDRCVMAMVQGRQRVFVVDYNARWSSDWLCTCGRAPTCPHIRATKEAIGQ